MLKKVFDLKGQTHFKACLISFSFARSNLFFNLLGVENKTSVRLITLIVIKSKFYKLYLVFSETY